jgi:hypothetical protein
VGEGGAAVALVALAVVHGADEAEEAVGVPAGDGGMLEESLVERLGDGFNTGLGAGVAG